MSMTSDPLPAARGAAALAYHEASKHRFEHYAPGPEALDWDAQPAPFRHFAGAPAIALPSPEAAIPQAAAPLSPSLESVSVVLRHAFGISAWKCAGPDRWAVRCNPSSGNLHPTEAYVVAQGIPGMTDGVLHYRPEVHSLEQRTTHASPPSAPFLAIALSSVMWRETWKYGLRAFRYCQLDTGHAMACVAEAAALTGWEVTDVRSIGHAGLTHLLGLDRVHEFPGGRPDCEREEAEVLLQLHAPGMAAAHPAMLAGLAEGATWHGMATHVDPHPLYRWPDIDAVAAATRRAANPSAPPIPVEAFVRAGPQTILQRRSAQHFDPHHVMPAAGFATLMTLAGRATAAENLSLLLFVHRVEGLEPGVYLLAPTTGRQPLLDHLATRFAASPPLAFPALDADCARLHRITTVEPQQFRRIARALHCHQDIGASACLAFGMLSPLEHAVSQDPAAYRDALRAAGRLGQVLYLQAEIMGLRGTGIGCFFDDPVHGLLDLPDKAIQTLYHFTIGLPIDDPRIETTSAYSGDSVP